METRVKFLQNIQDREKDFKELTKAEESIQRSAQIAVTESERVFGEVVSCLQKTCCRVKELIADQQRTELSHIEGLQEKVQQKIAGMKMKVSELDQFMTTEDHIHFLQNYPSDCEESPPEEFEDLSSISEHPDAFYHNVRTLVSKMQKRLIDVTKTTEIEIKSVKALPPIGGTVKLSATPAFKDERWKCDISLGTNEDTSSFNHDGNPFSTGSGSCVSVQFDQKDIFRFGESVPALNFSFQHVLSSVLNQTGASGTETYEPYMSQTYEPAVPLPDLIEISTGEENEQVVFSHKAKLYHYDKESIEWKERGVGILKILRNNKLGRARLVMRREQVLKLCANHWITPDMKLKPMKASEKAWTWIALDFADGESRDQTLAVRFRLQETADAFREIFEEATAYGVSERGKSSQERCDADVEIVFERKPTAEQAELAARLMLPHTFFCYKHQLGDLSHEDDDEDFEEAVKSLKGKLYPGLSIQGDLSTGHDANLPRENAGAATETQSDGEDSDDDDDDDEAHIHVDLPSVEENEEEMLLKERVKLYSWDCDINKWKARGEGDIKILFHPSRMIYRVLMRQGDEKVCVNHCITRAIHLKPMNTSANAVTWTAADSSEGDAVLRRFAAKFKTPELAVSFTKTLTDCQSHMSEFKQTLKK